MRKYIVFVSKDHYNPVGIVRTLGESGINPIAVVVDSKPHQVVRSKYVKEKYIVANSEEGLELIKKKFGHESEKPFILTGDDVTVALLDSHYDELKDHFFFYNAGAQGRIKEFMNKDTVCALAEKHGFKIPKTLKVKHGEIPCDLEYPIFTKAVNSFGAEWKDIVFVCHNEVELKQAYAKIKSPEIIIQKYIEKTDEHGYDGFSVNRGKDCFFSVLSTGAYTLPKQYPATFLCHNVDNQDVIRKASAMLEEIGFEGIFEFEFMVGKDDGELYFLEINFRNTINGWETTIFGMPSATLWCESMLRGYIDREHYYKKIPEGAYAIAECFDYDVRVKNKIMTHKEWMKMYRKADCKLYKGRKDPMPFVSFMVYKLFHKFH